MRYVYEASRIANGAPRAERRPGPSGNTRQGQRDRDGFRHGIYFIRQSDNTGFQLSAYHGE